MSSRLSLIDRAGFAWQAVNQGLAAWRGAAHRAPGPEIDREDRVPTFPSERDMP